MRTIPQRERRKQKGRWVPRAEVMKLLAGGKADPGFFQDVADLGTLDDLELLQDRIEIEKGQEQLGGSARKLSSR